jgi:tRNA threonylcarbamoyladenosine biosynthesis protein TsaE
MKRKSDELIILRAIKTSSEDETIQLGFNIGKNCKGGEVIALCGDLGAGKTNFVKGVGKGLNINRVLTSPTFLICQSYMTGRLPLYHFDLYRVSDFSEVEDIGWYDFLNSKGVIIIEWAEKIEDFLFSYQTILWVFINIISENEREFVFKTNNNQVSYLLLNF